MSKKAETRVLLDETWRAIIDDVAKGMGEESACKKHGRVYGTFRKYKKIEGSDFKECYDQAMRGAAPRIGRRGKGKPKAPSEKILNERSRTIMDAVLRGIEEKMEKQEQVTDGDVKIAIQIYNACKMKEAKATSETKQEAQIRNIGQIINDIGKYGDTIREWGSDITKWPEEELEKLK